MLDRCCNAPIGAADVLIAHKMIEVFAFTCFTIAATVVCAIDVTARHGCTSFIWYMMAVVTGSYIYNAIARINSIRTLRKGLSDDSNYCPEFFSLATGVSLIIAVYLSKCEGHAALFNLCWWMNTFFVFNTFGHAVLVCTMRNDFYADGRGRDLPMPTHQPLA